VAEPQDIHPCYPPGLLGVDEAIARLVALARQRKPAVECVALSDAVGRVLAEDVVAQMDVPPQANSAMDGIAFCHADLPPSAELRISQRIAAGQMPVPLEPHTAARIFTGAVLPLGADTVVMQENCEFLADSSMSHSRDNPGVHLPGYSQNHPKNHSAHPIEKEIEKESEKQKIKVILNTHSHVRLNHIPLSGTNVRPAGQDVAVGTKILSAGDRINPAALGLLASIGLAEVSVYQRLRVAVLATGDELLEPGEVWQPGRIYNSNRPMLMALLSGWGCDVVDLGRVKDSRSEMEAALKKAAINADVIISTGGVSVGEEDHVQAALLALGRVNFWKVAIKPGKPILLGEINQAVFLGLPGNPQAVLVTALLLARPFLLTRQGQQQVLPTAFALPAGFSWGMRGKKPGDRREYLRVKIQPTDAGLVLQLHAQQSSGALLSAVWGDGLAEIEAGSVTQEGQIVSFLPFSTLYQP
jgi:molybdopterin molybdotransferase